MYAEIDGAEYSPSAPTGLVASGGPSRAILNWDNDESGAWKVLVDGEVVTDQDDLGSMEKAFSNPFMKGETTAYVTKSFDGKTWVFDQDLDSKTKVTTTATKQ